MLSEELSYEYYYCYVLLSVDNISVVVLLTRRGGGWSSSLSFLVINQLDWCMNALWLMACTVPGN